MPLIENTPSFFSPHGSCLAFEPLPDLSDHEVAQEEHNDRHASVVNALKSIVEASEVASATRSMLDRLIRDSKGPDDGWAYIDAKKIFINIGAMARKAEICLQDLGEE